MDNILVANTGSSSVKFQVFAIGPAAKLTRKIKGQVDGIGTRPRLRASGADGTCLVDREYDSATISGVPAALHTAGAWLRDEQRLEPRAVNVRRWTANLRELVREPPRPAAAPDTLALL